MNGLFDGATGERLRKFILAAVILLTAFLAVQAIGGIKEWRYIGAGLPATNIISVSGHGEAVGVPDVATFSFSVTSLKPTVAAAQEEATAKIGAITEYLADAGVEEKDIKTSDYSVYPQYEYQNSVCPAATAGAAVYCPAGRQILRGYEVRQTTSVKVRDTEKAGELLAGVGEKGATEVSGLNFTFDDPDQIQAEARDSAITNAKEKAEVLARSLGVRLVRVVSYSEDGYPYPMYDSRIMYSANEAGAQAVKATAPDISVGQNKVTSDVSVTYEIR